MSYGKPQAINPSIKNRSLRKLTLRALLTSSYEPGKTARTH
jgi:hypothetical protein